MSDLVAGLILNSEFHQNKKWVAPIFTPNLVDALIDKFNCVIINNQDEFDRHYNDVDFFVSMEPGWAAPVIDYRRRLIGIPTRTPKLCYILFSDPHIEQWREQYFLRNRIHFVLALYYEPTLYHFRRIPRDRIIHFPWAVPDEYITTEPISFSGNPLISCYGASHSEAYELRNWCRKFDFVTSSSNSGVENKVMTNMEFLAWLNRQDAAIAAGSDAPQYRLTMPKYFEIPASGALLFAQETDDLERLGFRDEINCIVFNRKNFMQKSQDYLSNPRRYLTVRERGRALILKKHTLSLRLNMLEKHVRNHL